MKTGNGEVREFVSALVEREETEVRGQVEKCGGEGVRELRERVEKCVSALLR